MAFVNKLLIGYWAAAFVFIIIFGEIIPGIISENPTFFEHWFAISLYYVVLTFIFSILFATMKTWLVLLSAFLYGGIAEVFFFRGIRIFIVAGAFYVFLLGVPYLVIEKIRRRYQQK